MVKCPSDTDEEIRTRATIRGARELCMFDRLIDRPTDTQTDRQTFQRPKYIRRTYRHTDTFSGLARSASDLAPPTARCVIFLCGVLPSAATAAAEAEAEHRRCSDNSQANRGHHRHVEPRTNIATAAAAAIATVQRQLPYTKRIFNSRSKKGREEISNQIE